MASVAVVGYGEWGVGEGRKGVYIEGRGDPAVCFCRVQI